MIAKSRARLQATCDFPSYHSKNYKQITNNKEVSIVIRQTDRRMDRVQSPIVCKKRAKLWEGYWDNYNNPPHWRAPSSCWKSSWQKLNSRTLVFLRKNIVNTLSE